MTGSRNQCLLIEDASPEIVETPSATTFYRRQRALGNVNQVVTLPQRMVANLERYAVANGLKGRGAAIVDIFNKHPEWLESTETRSLFEGVTAKAS